jgi:pimeloyl-ACP methyl ester carboxylesterase
MNRQYITRLGCWTVLALFFCGDLSGVAQQPPYQVFPEAVSPYYRVRYEASTVEGELRFPVNYTVWIPPTVKTLRGLVVHQHGCGEGSCKSGLTGAFDLHWQALAKKHDCALLAAAYEQPENADCQKWCDPRNGSDAAFQRCLVDLGEQSGHRELSTVPWALWGHSGGGHWAGGMTLLHPERVAAAWLRSGVPLFQPNPDRPTIKVHHFREEVLQVPIMCNLGTKEGYSNQEGRFAGVWPANEAFFRQLRSRSGLVGVAIDPLTSHECGNQRYLAIRWLDACLTVRLPKEPRASLGAMPSEGVWLAEVGSTQAFPESSYEGDRDKALWLPNESTAKAWMEYVNDTAVSDATPPPAPSNVRVQGQELVWETEADLESGLAGFIIERDGTVLTKFPEASKNPFGRSVFQNLQYSDTPTQPLVQMRYVDAAPDANRKHRYAIKSVNTLGLISESTAAKPVARQK